MNKKDKILGLMFGQAIGDALGLGTEFMSKAEVKQFYPNGLSSYDQIIQDSHRKRWKVGDWTDDTDQMLCIAKAIIKDNDLLPLSVAEELYAWFKGTPMGIGRSTYQVLSFPNYLKHPEDVAKMIWKMSQYANADREYNAPNGAVMRTPIVGLWNKDTISKAEEICKLTHYDPRCVGSCVIISVLVNSILNDKPISKDDLIQLGNNYDDRIQEYIELSCLPDISYLRLDEEGKIGYTLKTMAAGLWAYFNCNNFEDGLKAVIHEGGDSDTNAAVACAILGIKHGYDSISIRYIDELYRKKYLHEISRKLLQLLNQ